MHVEFRLSELAHTCAFDPESFYRMKQVLAWGQLASPGAASRKNTGAGIPGSAPAGALGTPLVGSRKAQLIHFEGSQPRSSASKSRHDRTDAAPKELLSDRWRPMLRVQFVFERLVKMESFDLKPALERKQHEKQVENNWDGSEIRTKRYSDTPNEVILAALPDTVMDCVVKIRLLQLPPDLGSGSLERSVERAIGPLAPGGSEDSESRRDTPLCIGVAKITLRELMTVRGGVCIALQPKNRMLRAVEELNLNTVATNGMFGKDVGGSSFFTFQVISFSFGKVSPTKLLMYKERKPRRRVLDMGDVDDGATDLDGGISVFGVAGGDRDRDRDDPGSVSRQASFQYRSSGRQQHLTPAAQHFPAPSPPPRRGGSTDGLSSDQGRFSDHSDPLSQRSSDGVVVGRLDSAAVRFVIIPYMTLVDFALKLHDIISWHRPRKTLVIILTIVLVVLADALDIAFLVLGFCGVVTAIRAMTALYRIPVTDKGAGPLTSSLSAGAAEESYAYLYGRHNTLLNALVRARLFFTQGLQDDSYYELVLIFHTIRHRERHIIVSGVMICASMCFLSVETLLLLLLFSLFVIYPISVRSPVWRGQKSRKSKASPPITLHSLAKGWKLGAPMRIVRIVHVAMVAPQPEVYPEDLAHFRPQTRISMPQVLNGNTITNNDNDCDSPFIGISPSTERASAYGPVFAHRHASTFDFTHLPAKSPAAERQQTQNAARMAYAVISFHCTPGSMLNDRANPCAALVSKLRSHFALARRLNDDEGSAAPNAARAGSPRGSVRPAVSNYPIFGAAGTAGNPSTQYASSNVGGAQSSASQDFFAETLHLITFIRRSCKVQAFVSPGTQASALAPVGYSASTSSASRVPLEFFANPAWLVEVAPDDGITATIRAMSKNNLHVQKIPEVPGAEKEARALALLSASLLQGMCLSIYWPGVGTKSCAMIIPLEPGSTRLKPIAQPNPCPISLLSALDEIWRGTFASGASRAPGLTITTNALVQIITASKDEKSTRPSKMDGSASGDGQQQLQQSAQQRADTQPHASPRTTFLHAFTSPFAPADASQLRQGGGGLSRQGTLVIGGAGSPVYGSLGASRGENIPSREFQSPRPRASHTPPPSPPKRAAYSAPATAGGGGGGGAWALPAAMGNTPPHGKHANGSGAKQGRAKRAEMQSMSFDASSSEPPAVLAIYRGGVVELSSANSTYSPSDSSVQESHGTNRPNVRQAPARGDGNPLNEGPDGRQIAPAVASTGPRKANPKGSTAKAGAAKNRKQKRTE